MAIPRPVATLGDASLLFIAGRVADASEKFATTT